MTQRSSVSRDPADYGHWTEITLRYGDEDRMGHINNAAYVTYFEASRVNLIDPFVDGERIDFVLARLTVDYLMETRFPGTVRVGARVEQLGNRSITTHYALFKDAQCLATCICINVFFDVVNRVSTAPEGWAREAIEAFMAASPSR
ncbi:MAG: thioesterase family protein [Pseudomonadota bacterium]